MARIPNGTIDLTVTSPPYDNLRKYNGYSFPFEQIAEGLWGITKEGGTVVWVVGDATNNFNESLTSFKQALFFQKIGFNVETMIYEKESITWNENSGRYKQNFEYMFILSKGKPKFNPIRDVKVTNMNPRKAKSNRTKDAKYDIVIPNEITARGNIWYYPSGSSTNECSEHPAVFPEQLAADHIRSWSNEGDIVYDCFGGSGTTAKMAHLLNRKWILSEISKEYCELAAKRLDPYLRQASLFTPMQTAV